MADSKLIELIQANDNAKVKEYLDSIKNSYVTKLQAFLGSAYNPVNDLTPDKNSPLSLAVKQNNPEMVKLLIKYGADINYQTNDNNLFELAIKNSANIKIIQTLKEDKNFKAKGNEDELLKKLIVEKFYKYPSLIKYNEMLDWLKLMQTPNFVINSNLSIFQLFYDYKIDLIDELKKIPGFNILEVDKNFLGEKIFDLLIFSSATEDNIKPLIELGANLNYNRRTGETPLYIAVRKNNQKIAEYLLSKGVDVNKNDKASYSPLYQAIKNNNLDLVKKISSAKDFKLEEKDAGEIAYKAFLLLKDNKQEQAQNLLKFLPNVNIDMKKQCDYFGGSFSTIFANLIDDNKLDQAEYIKNQPSFLIDEESKALLAQKIYENLKKNNYEQVNKLLSLGGDINSILKDSYGEETTIFGHCINNNYKSQAKFIKEQSNFKLQEEDKATLAKALLKKLETNTAESAFLIELGAELTFKINEVDIVTTLIQKGNLESIFYIIDNLNYELSSDNKIAITNELINRIRTNQNYQFNKYIEKFKIDPTLAVNETDLFSELLKGGDERFFYIAINLKEQLKFSLKDKHIEIIKSIFNNKYQDLGHVSKLIDLDPKVLDAIDINKTIINVLTKKRSFSDLDSLETDLTSLAKLQKKSNFIDKISQETRTLLNDRASQQINNIKEYSNKKLFETLIQIGANPNIKNAEGNTALSSIIKCGLDKAYAYDNKFVLFLLENGAKLNEMDGKGESPIILLIKNKKFDWIKDISNAANNISLKNEPIYIENALSNLPELFDQIIKTSEVIQSLTNLNIKFDLNQKQKGETLLTKAIKEGDIQLIKLLIKNDVDINLSNDENILPLDLAIKTGNVQTIKHLLALPDITGNIDKAREIIDIKNILITQARNFPGKPYINLAHSILSINDLNSEAILKEYKAMKLESIYFHVDQLKLDNEFAKFVKNLTKAGIKEILVFCNQEKSDLSNQLLLDFIAENKVRINLNIAPITNSDVEAIESDKLAQGNLLGCENIKLEENAYSLKYNNNHEVLLLNNRECDEKILANYLEHRKKQIDPNSNELYQAKYILQDESSSANRIQKIANRNEVNLEYSVSVSNQVSNSLETSLDTEISVDIDAEQESKKYDMNQVRKAVERISQHIFSENDLVVNDFIYELGKISDAVYNVFLSSNKIKYITEQALSIIIKNYKLIDKRSVVEGIDLDNLPQGLVFKNDTIFASNTRPSNMQNNGFTIKKDYIAPSLEGPFRSWLQFASKEGLTPLKYYKTKLANFPQHDPFLNRDLGFPKNLQKSSMQLDDYRWDFRSTDKMIKQFIFPSRSIANEAYRDLEFIKLTEVEKQKIDQIYQEFASRGLQQAFANIIKSHQIKKGDFLLKDETLAFFDKLFTEILPLNNSKKIDFFQKVLSQNIDSKELYLEDVFLSLDCLYHKLEEFIIKQEIAKEHHDFIYDRMISILATLDKEVFASKLNKIYSSMEATAANGGNLHELLYYYNKSPNIWLSQASFKENLARHKLNTIYSFIVVSEKENLFIPFVNHNKDPNKTLRGFSTFENFAKYSKQSERSNFRNELNTYLSIIPPHQRPDIDNYWNYITQSNTTDFKTGQRTVSSITVDANRIIDSKFPLPEDWYSLDEIKKRAFLNKKNHEHLPILDEKIKEYYNLHRDEVTFIETTGLTSADKKCNLIDNYSSAQAENAVKLLSLNAITSTGNYYDLTYPDQEFSSYLSVFNILFEKVKINKPFQAAKIKEESHAEIAHEGRHSYVRMTEDKYEEVVPAAEITEKTKQHEKMIDEFIQVHMQNLEFNFAQITALGLVANLVPEKKIQTILSAKDLHQYGSQFSQFLRISLSNSITSAQDLSELTQRAKTINRNIEFLNQEHNGIKIHRLLTANGKNPENLAFFAVCFSKEENINVEQINALISRINALDKNLKWEFLEKIAHSQIPFEAGQIIDNNFPSIAIEDLKHPERLQAIIANNNIPQNNYTFMQRFNDISLDSRQNAVLNFAKLEKTYLGQDDLTSLKDLNYKQLKHKITTDPNFIVKLIKAPNDQDKEFISLFSQDLLQAIITNIAQRTATYELEARKTVDLLYDYQKPLSEQFFAFEASYQLLEKISKKLPNSSDKLLLIEQFTNKPRILQGKCHEILQYLNAIDNENLISKNYNILKLTQEVGNQVLNEHLNSFKLAVNLFLNSQQILDFKQLSNSLIALANKQYSEEQTVKIISYCIDNQDFTLANFFAQINGKTKNIQDSIDFLTSLKPQDIENINSHISLKKLINLRPLDKLNLVSKVIQKYGNDLKEEQYQLLYQSLVDKKKYEKNHYKKILSYLLNPGANLSNQENIEIIFSNFDKIDALKDSYKKINDEQTSFNAERFKKKISQITNLNADKYGPLSTKNADMLFEYGKSIYNLAKEDNGLSLSELTLKSQELQHQRMLMKENSPAEKLALDLQFLAVSCQVMKLTTNKFPKDTQILSLLTTITNQGNLAQQISTGQGKGLIVALHAAYMSYLGQTTIVTTSSQELASRDLKEFEPFYQGMNLKIGSKTILANSEGSEIENRGIYYSTSPDIALHLAQIKFNKSPGYEKFLADLSIISDEVDGKLTSEINYILGVNLANIEQDEAQSFFKHILEFSNSDIFLNSQVSRETDIHNLIESVKIRFSTFDRSLQYPISKIQLKKLASNNNPEAKEIININNVLAKLDKQGANFIIANLLEGAVKSKILKEGVNYVVSESHDKLGNKLLNAIPINKSGTLAIGTRFGNAQPFVNLKIKEAHPQSALEPDCTFPSSIIYDLTAKNLLDYIRLAKGRIIGFTGTLGDSSQLEEFSEVLAINSVAIPDYEDVKRIVTTHEVKNKQEQYLALEKFLNENKSDRPILIFVETNEEAIKLATILKNDGRQNIQLGDISLTKEEMSKAMKEVINNSGKNNYITVLTKGSGRGVDFKTEHEQGFLGYNLCTELVINDLFQINGRVGRQGTQGSMTSFFNKDQYLSFASHDEFMKYLSKKQTLERQQKRFIADVNQYFNNVNAGNTEEAIKSHDFIDRTWKYILSNNDALPVDERKTLGQLHNQLLKAVNEEYPGDARDLHEYLIKLKECLPGENNVCHLETKFTLDLIDQEKKSIEYIITSQNFSNFNSIKMLERLARAIHIDHVQFPTEEDSAEYKAFYRILKDTQDAIINTHTLVITPVEREFNITYNYHDILPNNFPTHHMVKGEGSKDHLMLAELIKSVDAYRDFTNNSQEVDKIAEVIANIRKAYEIDFSQFKPQKTQAISVSVITTENSNGGSGHAESILIDNNLLYLVNRGGGSDDEPGIKIFELIDNTEKVREVLSKFKDEKITLGNLEDKIISPIVKKDKKNSQPIYHYIPMPAQVIGNCGWAQLESQIKTIAIAGRLHDAKNRIDFKKLPMTSEFQSSLSNAEEIYKDFSLYDQIRRLESEIYTRDSNFKPQYIDKAGIHQIDKQRSLWRKPILDEVFLASIKTFDENLSIFKDSIYETYAEELSQKAHVELLSSSEMGLSLKRNGIKDTKYLFKNLDLENLKTLEQLYNDAIKVHIEDQLTQDRVLIKILAYINDNPEEESEFLNKLQEILDKTRIKLEGKDYIIETNMQNAANHQDKMLFSVLEDFADKKQGPYKLIEFSQEASNFVQPYDPNNFDFYNNRFIDQDKTSKENYKNNITVKIPEISVDGIIHQIQFLQAICSITKNMGYNLYCNFYVPNFSPDATEEELSQAKKIIKNSANTLKECNKTYDIMNGMYQLKVKQHNQNPDDKLYEEISNLAKTKDLYYENIQSFKNLCKDFVTLKKEGTLIKKANVEILAEQYKKLSKIDKDIQETVVFAKNDKQQISNTVIPPSTNTPSITSTNYLSSNKISNHLQQNQKLLRKK